MPPATSAALQAVPASHDAPAAQTTVVPPNTLALAPTGEPDAHPQRERADVPHHDSGQAKSPSLQQPPGAANESAPRFESSTSTSTQTASSPGYAAIPPAPSSVFAAINTAFAAKVPSPAPSDRSAVPIDGIAVEIATRAHEGARRFEIRLDPPELGRIDVRLDIGRDGQVTSRLVVERADTLDLLRRDAGTLERALQSAGLRTDDAGLQFSLRDQPGGQWHRRDDHAPRPSVVIVPNEDVAVREAVRRGYGVLRGLGHGIDIRI